jgi:hypothetical protein
MSSDLKTAMSDHGYQGCLMHGLGCPLGCRHLRIAQLIDDERVPPGRLVLQLLHLCCTFLRMHAGSLVGSTLALASAPCRPCLDLAHSAAQTTLGKSLSSLHDLLLLLHGTCHSVRGINSAFPAAFEPHVGRASWL